jgi:hypothetical protein
MTEKIITQKELKEIVSYDKDTGVMTRNGKILGGKITPNDRYLRTMINGRRYKVHRLAWLYVYGEFPKHQIDHINGDRNDNRIANLRDVPQSDNNRNASKRVDNTTGHTGITKRSYKGKPYWVVRIGSSPRIHVGCFGSFSEAVCARKQAEIKYDFHENHGQIR